MKVLFIHNDAPYGTERTYNALRLARSPLKAGDTELRMFLIGDAATCAKAGQKVSQGHYNIGDMLGMIVRARGEIGVCGSCIDARGISEADLVNNAFRSSVDELTAWTKSSDNVIVF